MPVRLASLVLLVCGFLAAATSVAFCSGVRLNDPGSQRRGAAIDGRVWYPTGAGDCAQLGVRCSNHRAQQADFGSVLPLVVLSHGGGASYDAHYDTALALARAGFVAAAINHAGDTNEDHSQVLRRMAPPGSTSPLDLLYAGGVATARSLVLRASAPAFQRRLHSSGDGGRQVPDLNKIAPYCRTPPGS